MAAVDIGTMIERSPDILSGRPCIAGTGVSVRRIVGWYNLGLTPEEIAAKLEHLNLAQIHTALAYYHANRKEIRRRYRGRRRRGRGALSPAGQIGVSRIKLYLDEDAMDGDLARALRSRGI